MNTNGSKPITTTEIVVKERRHHSDDAHTFARRARVRQLRAELDTRIAEAEARHAEELRAAHNAGKADVVARIQESIESTRDALVEHYRPKIQAVDYVYSYAEPKVATEEEMDVFFTQAQQAAGFVPTVVGA